MRVGAGAGDTHTHTHTHRERERERERERAREREREREKERKRARERMRGITCRCDACGSGLRIFVEFPASKFGPLLNAYLLIHMQLNSETVSQTGRQTARLIGGQVGR